MKMLKYLAFVKCSSVYGVRLLSTLFHVLIFHHRFKDEKNEKKKKKKRNSYYYCFLGFPFPLSFSVWLLLVWEIVCGADIILKLTNFSRATMQLHWNNANSERINTKSRLFIWEWKYITITGFYEYFMVFDENAFNVLHFSFRPPLK